jgi:hypothetical protein
VRKTGTRGKNHLQYLVEKQAAITFACLPLAAQPNEYTETYKTHKETFLREVCSVMYVHIKV